MAIDVNNLNAMLAELQAASAAAQGKTAPAAGQGDGPDFSQVLKGAIDQVNQTQADAQKMAQDFSANQGNASLEDVMINLQKASLSFQQMVQVRNKLVSAYNDIMNTQV
ncbi:MAG TPA: flagellar hook-basal body complex protein FliE [Rhodocyclaceae bacterium]|jgi:flagellar hook-basal body complex protein FliE|nr:flagellar hook-basal body complex protein FliE [Rhodocyclaceae bacterium]